MLRVVELHQFLVKSCGGSRVEQLKVGPRGVVDDRVYMFTRPSGDFMSQRDFPGMCLVRPALRGQTIVLAAPGMPDFELPLAGTGKIKLQATMHERQFIVTVSDSQAGRWLAEFLKLDFEPLAVFQSPEDERFVRPGANVAGAGLGFQDGYPLMMISRASLSDLNSRLPPGEEVTMDRFRPSVVCASCGPYFEDTIGTMAIGGVSFTGESLCMRCPTIQTNQATGRRNSEPMKTLLSYRPTRLDGKGKKKPVFGRNFSHTNIGAIGVGPVIWIPA